MAKIRITAQQLIKVLETEPLKLPLTIIMRGMDKAEMDELAKLIKAKKKD